MSNILYDEYYVMTLSNNNYNLSNSKGAFAGNGKIAMYNSMTKIGTDQVLTSVGDVNFDQIGRYRNNVIEGFAMNDVRVFSPTDCNINYTMSSQTLNMLRARCSTVFNVTSNNSAPVTVKNTITPLRQYPYCVLQEVVVTPASNFQYLDIHHMFVTNSNIGNVEYNNNIFFNDKIYTNKGLYIMNAKGYNKETNSTIACASCYIDNSNILGFNVTNKKGSCYQTFRCNNALSGNELTFNIITAMMSDKDFPDPVEETKRILMNIAFKNSDAEVLLDQISSDNSAEWFRLWGSDIELLPKDAVVGAARDRVIRLKRYIRQSLYNIFCCVRDNVNSEVNPLALSYIDTNGNLFYDGDIWLVPALLILRPSIARTLLEYRYKGLEQAVQLAASYGFKGSKYPYENDIVGYKNVYWDVASPLHIFNNSVIAINAWNYFRVTIDKEWLANKGYAILKNVADFIIGNIDAGYNMNNVVGLGGKVSDNHAFTKYTARLALKYAIEASYELNFAPKTKWVTCYQQMDISYYTGANYDVIKFDNTFTNSQSLNIIDSLLILIPYYSYLYFNNNPNVPRDHTSVLRNINYYINTINATFANHPLNKLIIACMYGIISQSDTSYLNTFYTKLDDIIAAAGEKDWWGNLVVDPRNGVDLKLNGFLALLFLNIAGGIRIRGGITEGKFYYEAYGLQGPYSINLPSTWKSIVFSGVGNNEELYNVVNNVFNI